MARNTEALTYSLALHHANPSAAPGGDLAALMTARSGRRCFALSKKQGPIGFVTKTLIESCQWRSTMSLMTWRVRALKRNRLLFQLRLSERTISGTDAGLLPTPTAHLSKLQHAHRSRTRQRDGKSGPSLKEILGKVPSPAYVRWMMGFPNGAQN